MLIISTIIIAVLFMASCERPTEKITITHGPLLGRLDSGSIGIWARTAEPGTIHVEYGTSPEGLVRRSGPLKTALERDNTGWVELVGLTPGTKYYYRLVPGDPEIHAGSFKTLPVQEMFRNDSLNPDGLFNFSFEFACGNNQGSGRGASLPSFRTIIDQFADEIHFSIQNGDWLYETEERGLTLEEWRADLGISHDAIPEGLNIIPTIVGVWKNYKGYLERGKILSEFHRYVPCFYTFDDHEILNDVVGCGQAGYRNRRAVFRDIAVQAWYDYLGWSNPVPFQQDIHFGRGKLKAGSNVLYDPEADFTMMDRDEQINLHVHWGTETAGVNKTSLDSVGGDPNANVYDIVRTIDPNRLEIQPVAVTDGESSYSIGRHSYFHQQVGNCDFFFLDSRSSRTVRDHTDSYNPEKSMLGPQQRDWLLKGILSSTADFIFVVSSVNFMIPHISGGENIVSHKDDAWTAYMYERELLIETFDAAAAPVFVLTGDLHNSFAIKITDNVWEFASGPRNSRNHRYIDEGSRPATGEFTYGDRSCDIRWSTYFLDDTPDSQRRQPSFCVVQVNNVTNSPPAPGEDRFVAYERPQVVFRYYGGIDGRLLYAEAIAAYRDR